MNAINCCCLDLGEDHLAVIFGGRAYVFRDDEIYKLNAHSSISEWRSLGLLSEEVVNEAMASFLREEDTLGELFVDRDVDGDVYYATFASPDPNNSFVLEFTDEYYVLWDSGAMADNGYIENGELTEKVPTALRAAAEKTFQFPIGDDFSTRLIRKGFKRVENSPGFYFTLGEFELRFAPTVEGYAAAFLAHGHLQQEVIGEDPEDAYYELMDETYGPGPVPIRLFLGIHD